MRIEIGKPAPDFTVMDSDLNEARLEDYAGKPLVLLFFPLAFSGVCTKELCYMRDNLEDYNDLNANVLAISIDTNLSLKHFKEMHNLNFRVASDFNKEAVQDYGVMYDTFSYGMHGVAKRSAFVIDKDGIVRHGEVLEDAGNLPDFDKVKSALESLN